MVCRSCRKHLSAYLDGELTPPETERLEEHLDRCPACANVLGQYRRMQESLAALPAPEVHPDAWVRLQAEVARRAAPPAPLRERWWQPVQRRLLVSGGALAVLLLGLFLAWQHPFRPSPRSGGRLPSWETAAPAPLIARAGRETGEPREGEKGREAEPITTEIAEGRAESPPAETAVEPPAASEITIAPEPPAPAESTPRVRTSPPPRSPVPPRRSPLRSCPSPSPPPRRERGRSEPERLAFVSPSNAEPLAKPGPAAVPEGPEPLVAPSASASLRPPAGADQPAGITPPNPAASRALRGVVPPGPADRPRRRSLEGGDDHRSIALLGDVLILGPLLGRSSHGEKNEIGYHFVGDLPSGHTERRWVADPARGIAIETEEEERTTDGLEIASVSITVTETQPIPDPETGELTYVTLRRPLTAVHVAEVPTYVEPPRR